MKPVLPALLVLAAVATACIYWWAPAPSYTAPKAGDPDLVRHVLASAPATGETVRVLDVSGMCCSGCTVKLYGALAGLDGVREAAVDFDTRTASVIVPSAFEVAALEAALTFDKYEARARPETVVKP